MSFYFLGAAATAAINSDQFTLFYIELFGLVHQPFVMAITAQDFALVLLLERRLAKGNNVGHGLQEGALQGPIP